MSSRTYVKICGITRVADAVLASKLEAYAIGLNFWPQSPRCIVLAHARDVCRVVPREVGIAAVFVDPTPDLVRETMRVLPLTLLQFHGKESPEFCKQFGIPYVKAVRVGPDTDLLQYAAHYSDARALLLDAYVAGQPGGTGHPFNWQLIPPKMPMPIILSGGLSPSNVKAAIHTVRPWALDVASGVESAPGIKDAAKLAAFMREVRDADLRSP